MESLSNDNYAELPSVETPEDVAVLYSWANLHGAKYRDFSASRREYRAQLRHRAAEQARETELRAQHDAEDAAERAVEDVRHAEAQARSAASESAARMEAMREAEAAAQRASAERIEAARRAEAAADAQAKARREEREIAEAHASTRRKEILYIESGVRRTAGPPPAEPTPEVPGSISDPYTPQSRQPLPPVDHHPSAQAYAAAPSTRPQPVRQDWHTTSPSPLSAQPSPNPVPRPREPWRSIPELSPTSNLPPLRRPQGYRPDDASGVRQIYRPELEAPKRRQTPDRTGVAGVQRPHASIAPPVPPYATRESTLQQITVGSPPPPPSTPDRSEERSARSQSAASAEFTREGLPYLERRRAPEDLPPGSGVAGETEDPAPRRRRQDQPGYRMTDSDRAIAAYRREHGQVHTNAAQPNSADFDRRRDPARPTAPVLPAWINDQRHEQPSEPHIEQHIDHHTDPQTPGAPSTLLPADLTAPSPELAAETLQRSRERVASRWYALKGVFEQPGQERAEPQPARQRETRTPVLAVFSFAGGVGKTSLVATLGRSLSSLGEKVLLTDTTSHGLLPFYFGASELRESTVRTFSPPSGSTDAPIYLVNYAVDQAMGDHTAQEAVVDNITESGRGAHRILLDLTAATAWLIRRVAHLAPTILVPLAPDMNSVISLQPIERFLAGIDGPDGTPLKVFYVLNQFDAGLPLHLDVREVLRRQLGEQLLPTVIRRAPAVSEALAEGMTIVDYVADAPVAEDYMNVAHWLRSVAAPATAGFRNVRWSER